MDGVELLEAVKKIKPEILSLWFQVMGYGDSYQYDADGFLIIFQTAWSQPQNGQKRIGQKETCFREQNFKEKSQ
jgi:hypothetical protein